MAGLAMELSNMGHRVLYIYQQKLSLDRIDQGWEIPPTAKVILIEATTANDVEKLVDSANKKSIHVTQGLRANGLVCHAQKIVMKKLLRHFVIMETVDDRGWKGLLRKIEYRRLIFNRKKFIEGILSIGHKSCDWYASCGYPREKIYPFTYFLNHETYSAVQLKNEQPFRFIYVGQLVKRKRIDLLIRCLSKIDDKSFELVCVGSGEEEHKLISLSKALMPGKVIWLGPKKMTDIPNLMRGADCLVLPSIHDGWGAVISEAMMVGTPVICSDACGAAGAVKRSKVGGVFSKKSSSALKTLLAQQIKNGKINSSQRSELAYWAQCLSARNGAKYLNQIFSKSILPSSDFYSQASKIEYKI